MTTVITAPGLLMVDGKLPSENSQCPSSLVSRIVLAAIIVGAFFIFLLFSCITARRRRRQGMNPYRGTGWAAGRTPPGHAPAQYTGAQPYYANNNATAPPVYSPPVNQGYYNQAPSGGANQGYFGGQQQGVELQQPEHAYARAGEQVYQAPPGPPPQKQGDGIIR